MNLKPIERRLRALERATPADGPVVVSFRFDGESAEQAEARARDLYERQHGGPPPDNSHWLRVVFVKTGVPR